MMTLSYDGSNYHGWQVQKNAITVQEVFQKALEKVLKHKVEIKGCSRTDSGVHANMYTVSFVTFNKIKCENLVLATNKFLPGDIAATSCKEVEKNFHARYSCTGKEYIYRIWNKKTKNPFLKNYAFHYWYNLDINILKNTTKYFLGTHDFTSFATLDKRDPKNMVRTIEYLEIYSPKDGLIEIKIKADGFLYNMVRIIVGTLLRVAQGKIKPNDIENIIKSKNRSLAGPTIPATGLYLNKVFY
ncbi:MAG: tRNA pseudouridine(38-40) synthase TruA [Clostridia bacterium]|nr:tRNA pseudouridine(38-40) synthase TruA [Clostridia bacterium]